MGTGELSPHSRQDLPSCHHFAFSSNSRNVCSVSDTGKSVWQKKKGIGGKLKKKYGKCTIPGNRKFSSTMFAAL